MTYTPKPGVPVPPRYQLNDWLCELNPMATAIHAAEWAADEQLRLCVEWLRNTTHRMAPSMAHDMQSAMRPTPPTLKEQALKILEQKRNSNKLMTIIGDPDAEIIRRALEAE